MYLIWIGKYQSDIAYTQKYFKGSITYYGDNNKGNISCCKSYTREYNKQIFISFIIKNIRKGLGSCNYVFYNQKYAFEVINHLPESSKYIINVNSEKLICWLSNKTLVRLWINNLVKVPPFCAVAGNECTYANLKTIFPRYKKFIVQDNYSSGGIGSFLVDNNTTKKYEKFLSGNDIYLVSPLIQDSFSINLHMLVGKYEQIIFPLSIQIIDPNDTTFVFRGSDFVTAKEISSSIIEHINDCSRKIGEKLAYIGYRGICGLDFVVQNTNIYFIEINPRFQGSSFLINRVLFEKNLPSLYDLNMRAFFNESFQNEKNFLEKLKINYSFYKLKYDTPIISSFIYDCLKSPDVDIYFMDGLNIEKEYSKGYMCRFISKRNMVSINPNKQINIYQNLLYNKKLELPLKTIDDWTILKTSLLIQGIKISHSALNILENSGGIQEGTFDAIDIYFSDKIIINCPLRIPFSSFSPFTLNYANDKYELFYYETLIDTVTVDKKDFIPDLRTHSGLCYSKMVQRNNNRIRIRHNSVCIFKQHGKGCYFCHAKNEVDYPFDLVDIKESFLFFLKNTNFDKIMIGGASNDRKSETNIIKSIIQLIRNYTDKKIYIMTVPPTNLNEIKEYKRLGANEIAFNMEIYDEKIAKTLMPEKGNIPRDEYLLALKKATDIFGKNGDVRSMLLIGLEPIESFNAGIEALCRIGVSPMISPFRPMYHTKLQNFVPPTLCECLRYMTSALELTARYDMTLGPVNPYDQNNTLNIVIK